MDDDLDLDKDYKNQDKLDPVYIPRLAQQSSEVCGLSVGICTELLTKGWVLCMNPGQPYKWLSSEDCPE